tara:strand:+ start:3049 stop:3579 length:531 start_codon:yes stop_codon:yes gene_type:complete
MFNTIIIENFFDNFQYIENHFKKIPLLKFDDYPDKHKSTADEKWPGQRSLPLQLEDPFLTQLLVKEIHEKSDSRRLIEIPWRINLSIHLRLDDDNEGDFIHTDPCDLTMIVFLAKTNLDSGLNLYDNINNEIVHIKYVQNRAVIFHGRRLHKSHLNFGDNIDNGRLTLNAFIEFEK